MDYKEKDIWNRIHKMYDDMDETGKSQVERVFPELKESEDERIRKALIDIVNARCELYKGITKEMFLAWLEKQGDINPTEDELEALRIAAYEPTKNWSEKLQSLYEKLTHCEQKPADKVEPKFKVGDWIIKDNYSAQQVKELREEAYILDGSISGVETLPKKYIENNYHLWTIIKDAKDGDVLACNDEILLFKLYSVQGRISLYCWYNGQTNNFHNKEVVDTLLTTRNKVCPATKEQRDLLFQKMKEAGYEWDAEKKELKKIERKQVNNQFTSEQAGILNKHIDEFLEQKSTEWSEEDEEHLNSIISDIKTDMGAYPRSQEAIDIYNDDISFLKSLKERVQPQTKREWSEEDEKMFKDIDDCINKLPLFFEKIEINGEDKTCSEFISKARNWFKSLRPHWKPSKEQLGYLSKAIMILGDEGDCKTASILNELLTNLKKLREE